MASARPPLVLIVDDVASNRKVLETMLVVAGYRVAGVESGREALEFVERGEPDLVLLDIMMPGLSGIEVCTRLRARAEYAQLPIILVTALDAKDMLAEGLEAGADDFIQKPVRREELLARVKSLLRVKGLFDALREKDVELQRLNQTLEQRVQEQSQHIERLSRLKRYVSATVAERIVRDDRLAFHRALIAAVCCDLRNFTAFALRAEPEDTIRFLDDYYGTLGNLVMAHEGTIDHFTGDGVLVFFNDPIECEEPAWRAVQLAVAVREGVEGLLGYWRQRGYDLGLGTGVTYGYATMGEVGFEQRREYAGTGTPVNLASRLSGLAADGQILITQAVAAEIEGRVALDPATELAVKGFPDKISVHNVTRASEQ